MDVALVEAGLVESRAIAQALILAGKVRVGGETVREASRSVESGALEVVEPPRYVSRGGEKLAPALEAFGIDPAGLVAADIGASTGGFTDVLLQRGARRVYAVDVGRGLIHERLRRDQRVVLMERVNARDLDAESFPEPVALATVDVSFIGLEKVLPALRLAAPRADVVALFKPQFQVGRAEVGKGGVVRDPEAVRRSLAGFRAWAATAGYQVVGEVPSAIRGAQGNQELLLHLRPDPAP
ncbi:MAG TPA: TlyA family RNA methyltransferase [Candidatus Dormibacteraeota bacterium]